MDERRPLRPVPGGPGPRVGRAAHPGAGPAVASVAAALAVVVVLALSLLGANATPTLAGGGRPTTHLPDRQSVTVAVVDGNHAAIGRGLRVVGLLGATAWSVALLVRRVARHRRPLDGSAWSGRLRARAPPLPA